MTGLLPAALAEFVRLHPQLEIYLEPGELDLALSKSVRRRSTLR